MVTRSQRLGSKRSGACGWLGANPRDGRCRRSGARDTPDGDGEESHHQRSLTRKPGAAAGRAVADPESREAGPGGPAAAAGPLAGRGTGTRPGP